jgi:hypothetical protein
VFSPVLTAFRSFILAIVLFSFVLSSMSAVLNLGPRTPGGPRLLGN